MNKTKLLVILGVLSLFLTSCSGEENPSDGDSDIEHEMEEEIVTDGDSDEQEIQDCEEKQCSEGRYCDPADGLCKVCVEDSDCGLPDVITGVYPVCRDSKCDEVVCPAVVEVTAPEDGFEIPTTPATPVFLDKYIVVNDKKLFPIGFQGLNPELFSEAKDAGAILVVSNRICCANNLDLEYQKQQVLKKAQSNDLLASVIAVWPWEDYDAYQMEVTNAMKDRYNITSTLFWVVSDGASSNDKLDDVQNVTDVILDYPHEKPMAIFETSGYLPAEYPDEIMIHVVDLDIESQNAGQEIFRLQSAMPQKSIWARLDIENYSEQQLKAAALHAISHGARGIIININDEENTQPEYWDKAKNVSRYLRDRTELWLEGNSNKMVEVISSDKARSYNAIYNGKVSISYLVNPSNQKQSINLGFKNEEFPFCTGFEDSNTFLQITNKQQLEVELEPYEIRVLYMSEAAYTGD